MSASMKQGLADLLFRKTSIARNKASDLFVSVRKDLGAIAKHAEHKLYSELIGLANKQMSNADKLLGKHDASYFDYLDALINLERLASLIRQIGSLADHYATRRHLAKQADDIEERQRKCEGRQRKCEGQKKSVPNLSVPSALNNVAFRGATGVLMVLAMFVGYFVVGYLVANDQAKYARIVSESTFWWYNFLLWPLIAAVPVLLFGKTSEAERFGVMLLHGLIPPAIVVCIEIVRLPIMGGVQASRRARYNKAQQRLKQLSEELAELSKQSVEISKERAGVGKQVGAVDRTIAETRKEIMQKISDIKWK